MAEARCLPLILCLSLAACSATKGDDSPANSTVNIDVGGAVSQLTPRGCATQLGVVPYGSGPAGMPCQVFHPMYGWIAGMTVK